MLLDKSNFIFSRRIFSDKREIYHQSGIVSSLNYPILDLEANCVQMKSIVVVSKGKNTALAICDQLRRLLGSKVAIKSYCTEDRLDREIWGDLILFSSRQTYEAAAGYIRPDSPAVVARRSINYHEVGKLFDIPAGADVLLVNDMLSTANQTIEHLQALGIDHIHYHPYAPETDVFPRLPIAVTPGEEELVPDFVEQIINIKVRLIDISTLVEILIRLDLFDLYADFLSANYVRDMVRLIKSSTKMMRSSNKMKLQLQTILNTVHDGIIATDEDERISVFNPIAEELLNIRAEGVLGYSADQLVNEDLLNILSEKKQENETLVKVNQHHLIVNIANLHPEQINSGKVYTFKDVSEIRRMEEAARRKLIHEQKAARYTLFDVAGDSDGIRSTLRIARKMAGSNSTILIQGESGTGKEIIAQGIHNASARRTKPFIAVNFAALTESLLESELFGYIGGAFTGASRGGAPGLFEEAHKGTIFLDEIGDAPLPFQVKLLRVLQEQQIRRVGSSKIIPVDVRVIVATNRDLKRLIAEGQFRQDLYYRLNVLPIKVPPLRERGGDILTLAHIFYQNNQKRKNAPPAERYFRLISPYLLQYRWPGNIRELQNVVEYLVNISPDAPPESAHLPDEIRETIKRVPLPAPERATLKRDVYREILAANCQNRSIGRRSLAEILHLPENRIRCVLREMQAEGIVVLQRGRKGLKICPARPGEGTC